MHESFQNVSMRDIAKHCGVHMSTVSRALRDAPGVSPKEKERIRKFAEELGYRPNPQVAAHMRAMKVSGRIPHLTTIGFLMLEDVKGGIGLRYVDGAKARARELGFHLDVIDCYSRSARKGTRIERILKARGIECILLPPESRDFYKLHLTWENYHGVIIGNTHAHLHYTRVVHDAFHSVRFLVHRAIRKKYQEIALVDELKQEKRIRYQRRAGFLLSQNLLEEKFSNLNFEILPQEVESVYQWIQRKTNPILLTDNPVLLAKLSEKGIDWSKDCALLHLNKDPEETHYAGMSQQAEKIGESAVEAISESFMNQKKGFKTVPGEILLKGSWHDGPSL